MNQQTDDAGILFAATGEHYRNLARRAARTVRQVMPQIPIDLFTDRPVEDAVFSQVHRLERVDARPKLEALQRSRFRRSLYLDCDTVMLHPVDEVFDLLETAEIAGAHEQFGNSPVNLTGYGGAIPLAFRQINSGVLGVRRTEATTEFLRRYQEEFLRRNAPLDQPILRELLFTLPVRLIVLPPEYNTMYLPFVRVSNALMMAPRILHIPGLHERPEHAEPADQPYNVAELVSPQVRDRLAELARSDRTLGAGRSVRAYVGDMARQAPWLYRVYRRLRRLIS